MIVPSPSLQIHPLVVSGPSANRIDLVFFSDGCRPPTFADAFTGTEFYNIQILLKNKISLLRMLLG